MVKIGCFWGLKVKNLKNVWNKSWRASCKLLVQWIANLNFKKMKLLEYFFKYWNPRKMPIVCSYFFFQKCAFFALKRIFFEKVCIIRNKIHAILDRIGLIICQSFMFLKDLWRFENSVQTFVHGPVHSYMYSTKQ